MQITGLKNKGIPHLDMFLVDKESSSKQSDNTPSTSTTEFFKSPHQSKEPRQSKKWTKKENDSFFNAIAEYGNDTAVLLRELPMRTPSQVDYHIDLMFGRIKKNINHLRAIENIEERRYKTHTIKQILLTLGTKFEKQKYEIHISKEIAIEIISLVNQFIALYDSDVSEVFSMIPNCNSSLDEAEAILNDNNSMKISIPLIECHQTQSEGEFLSQSQIFKQFLSKEEEEISLIPNIFQEKSLSSTRDQGSSINEKQFLGTKRKSSEFELESTKTDCSSQLNVFFSFFKNEMFFGASKDKPTPCDGGKEELKWKNVFHMKDNKARSPLTEEDACVDNPFNLSFDECFFSSNENEINNSFNYCYSSFTSSNDLDM